MDSYMKVGLLLLTLLIILYVLYTIRKCATKKQPVYNPMEDPNSWGGIVKSDIVQKTLPSRPIDTKRQILGGTIPEIESLSRIENMTTYGGLKL